MDVCMRMNLFIYIMHESMYLFLGCHFNFNLKKMFIYFKLCTIYLYKFINRMCFKLLNIVLKY